MLTGTRGALDGRSFSHHPWLKISKPLTWTKEQEVATIQERNGGLSIALCACVCVFSLYGMIER